MDANDDYASASAGLRWQSASRVLFFALVLIIGLAGYAASQFRGLRDPSAMESAQVARNMAEGRGFVTDFIRPFDYGFVKERGILPDRQDAAFPVLWMAPGLPAVQSLAFRLLPPGYVAKGSGNYLIAAETHVILPLGLLFTLLTVLAVWLLGKALFDARVATLSSVAYAVSTVTLDAAISGMPIAFAALPTVLCLLFAVHAVQRAASFESGWRVALFVLLSATCAAAATLIHYGMLAVGIASCLFLVLELQRRKGLMTLLYALVLGGLLAAWLLSAQQGIGGLGAIPYAALRDTFLFPGDSLERTATPAFNAYRLASAIRQGVAMRLMDLASGKDLARGGIILAFFLLALFHRYEHSVCKGMKGATVIATLLLTLLPPLPGETLGGWVAIYPVMVVLGISAFADYLDREELFDISLRPLLTGLLLILCGLPAGLRMISGGATAYPPYHAPLQRFAGEAPPAGQALLTDIPWATAWYGRCRSIQIPLRPDDVTNFPGGWDAIGGIYLTTLPSANSDPAWSLLLLGQQVPGAIPFDHGVRLPAGRADQLLLTRSEQWQQPEQNEAQ